MAQRPVAAGSFPLRIDELQASRHARPRHVRSGQARLARGAERPSDGGGRSTAWPPATSMPSVPPHSHMSSGTTLSALSPFSGSVHRQTGLDTPALPPDCPAPFEARGHRAGDPWPLYASLTPRPPGRSGAPRRAAPSIHPRERRRLWRSRSGAPGSWTCAGRGCARARRGARRPYRPATRSPGARGTSARPWSRGLVLPSAARPGYWNLVVFPAAFAKVRVLGSKATHPAPPD